MKSSIKKMSALLTMMAVAILTFLTSSLQKPLFYNYLINRIL